jgi:hypothetical protein
MLFILSFKLSAEFSTAVLPQSNHLSANLLAALSIVSVVAPIGFHHSLFSGSIHQLLSLPA